MDEIVNEFLVECYEGLDQLDQNFIDLEESPDDTGTITEAFRVLHTIKGTCGFLGFSQLELVAHRGENLLSLLRDSVLSMSADIADALLATVDAIRDILGTIEETGEEGQHDNAALVARLEELGGMRPATGAGETAPAGADEGTAPAGADEETAPAGADEGTAPAGADEGTAPEAEAAVDQGDAEPEVAEASGEAQAEVTIPEPPQYPSPRQQSDDAAPEAEPMAATAAETADEAVAEQPAAAEPPQEQAAPAAADDDKARIGDILVDQGSAERVDVEIAAAEQQLGDARQLGKILVDDGRAEQTEVDQAAAKQRGAADSSIRVDVAVLDKLMNLVGELVLSRNQIVQLAGEEVHRGFAAPAQRLNLITSELQEGVMRTRMQPIGNVWNKLPRVVRDLSQQFGKQIRLEMEGKETELDRTILEAIKDPLTHMVRNTVDHGIEDPETRKAAGKGAEGILKLSASHEGGQVNIEISDDGAGIDPTRMKAKAVEKGVITKAEADEMSDSDAVMLIFAPGFSTAAKVSNVSGRGVGMDVVRTNVERIGGSVDVKSKVGQGTVFGIKIPLTLAIVPALTIRCGGNRYAIPQVSLQELVRLDQNDTQNRIEDLHGAPVYRLRERLLPIVDLRAQLGVEPADNGATNIVVLQADGPPFGLLVDAIENTEEIVVKPLGREVNDIALFSGATIMGDGKVALILDVQGLATTVHLVKNNRDADNAAEAAGPTEIEPADDVLNDRTLLVVGFGGNSNAAIPLSAVERLEDFRPDQIEESGHHMVVQYRGSILPVLDLGPACGFGQSAFDEGRSVKAVVCNHRGVSVGLAVASILDIVSGAEVHNSTATGTETAVIHGNVSDVIDVESLLQQYFPVDEPIGVLA